MLSTLPHRVAAKDQSQGSRRSTEPQIRCPLLAVMNFLPLSVSHAYSLSLCLTLCLAIHNNAKQSATKVAQIKPATRHKCQNEIPKTQKATTTTTTTSTATIKATQQLG